jgi:hypothetical protein
MVLSGDVRCTPASKGGALGQSDTQECFWSSIYRFALNGSNCRAQSLSACTHENILSEAMQLHILMMLD